MAQASTLVRGLTFALSLGLQVGVCEDIYVQHNLVSDIPGMADFVDSNLVNPWGMSFSATSPFWVSDNGKGVTTLYNGIGQPQSLVVTIPPGASSAPTGQVFNPTSDFTLVPNTPTTKSNFIFATQSGTISGWAPTVNPTNAVIKVDNSAAGAVYTGLAIGSNATGNFLYAANFSKGTIDVFNGNFGAATLSGSFHDPNLPDGYSPFNIHAVGEKLYVEYAKVDPVTHDEQKGVGNGFVNVFDMNGNLVQRLASNGPLNAPWGVTLAPAGFGTFGGSVLVGNFGDGMINAYNATSGALLGNLKDALGNPIAINGLWGIDFRTAGAFPLNTLFFAAGINEEENGLFGQIQVAPEPSTISLIALSGVLVMLRFTMRRFQQQ
jgi:uncharacterized protein (TIGR03118 family)